MELRDYLSVRRAYNIVRQQLPTKQRLTFSEFAILCRLRMSGGSLRTSDIAEYQDSLRPTTTHRTKHLSTLGLITREKGDVDRRNVVCTITDEGERYLEELCELTCGALRGGQSLSRVTPERLCLYIDAMGAVSCLSGELVLLVLFDNENHTASVSELVNALGLLQPTVSMSVSSLVDEGLVVRSSGGESSRVTPLTLSAEGRLRAEELSREIAGIVVRRRNRR